eukprot:scaffold2224_cov261-Pinguiococcus_pyrenoidosus.AAC.54
MESNHASSSATSSGCLFGKADTAQLPRSSAALGAGLGREREHGGCSEQEVEAALSANQRAARPISCNDTATAPCSPSQWRSKAKMTIFFFLTRDP